VDPTAEMTEKVASKAFNFGFAEQPSMERELFGSPRARPLMLVMDQSVE